MLEILNLCDKYSCTLYKRRTINKNESEKWIGLQKLWNFRNFAGNEKLKENQAFFFFYDE